MLEVIDHQGIYRGVRELRLARPPVNALGVELIRTLEAALVAAAEAAASGAALRALVLSGAPGRFSAGLDLRELGEGEASMQALVTAFWSLQERLARSPLPLICAIGGHCPAGGAVMAILCDHRLMARGDFRIGLNEVQVGLYPGETVYRAFARIVGEATAASLLPRGVLLSPQQALEVGLVDELVDPGELVPRALTLATECAALPPLAYARTRTLVRRDLIALYEQSRESLQGLLSGGWITAETRERIAAMSQKTR
jgi:enoyl-CoA hydratase/carnithine racemase